MINTIRSVDAVVQKLSDGQHNQIDCLEVKMTKLYKKMFSIFVLN